MSVPNNQICIFHHLMRSTPDAFAHVTGSHEFPQLHGMIYFFQRKAGVYVTASFSGLPDTGGPCGSSVFAMHIHEGMSCTGNSGDPFADAGSHYNPENCEHPYHAGDLPPLFSNHGTAWYAFLTDRFRIDEIIGRTVIVHRFPDDFMTQPSGNSGAKIACGQISR